MNDAARVDDVERRGHGPCPLEDATPRHRPALAEHLGEVLPFEQLHRDEPRSAAEDAGRVDRDQRRMAKGREELGFLGPVVRVDDRAEELERDLAKRRPVGQELLGAPDIAESAAPEPPAQPVFAVEHVVRGGIVRLGRLERPCLGHGKKGSRSEIGCRCRFDVTPGRPGGDNAPGGQRVDATAKEQATGRELPCLRPLCARGAACADILGLSSFQDCCEPIGVGMPPEFIYCDGATGSTGTAMSTGGGPPADAHCHDGKLDADETDTDCGGADCTRCEDGKECKSDKDCTSLSCASGHCVAASCMDMIANGDETDIDCGGSCAPCANKKNCVKATDCRSGSCESGRCAPWAVLIAAGESHTCALRPNGQAECWGSNHNGQLGDGTNSDRPHPAPVEGDEHWTAIAGGLSHTCAVTNDGLVKCWGSNQLGQLGNGTMTDSPTAVASPVSLGRRSRSPAAIIKPASLRRTAASSAGEAVALGNWEMARRPQVRCPCKSLVWTPGVCPIGLEIRTLRSYDVSRFPLGPRCRWPAGR